MATDRPRFSVSFTDDSFQKIEEYQKAKGFKTRSKAVAQLVEIALDKIESHKNKNSFPYSDEACKLARDYDEKLDEWGRRTVRSVADHEIERCEAAQKSSANEDGGAAS